MYEMERALAWLVPPGGRYTADPASLAARRGQVPA
jgi:hypothetical protein